VRRSAARGKLSIDDQLNATVSGLSVEGEGMVGAMIVSLVEDEIKQWDGRTFPAHRLLGEAEAARPEDPL